MSKVIWEPLKSGELLDYNMEIGVSGELRVDTEFGEMVVEFDDGVRVCRARLVVVPEPDWSKAPPEATHHAYDAQCNGWFWEASTKEPRWDPRIHQGWVNLFRIAPDDTVLAVGRDWRDTLTERPKVGP